MIHKVIAKRAASDAFEIALSILFVDLLCGCKFKAISTGVRLRYVPPLPFSIAYSNTCQTFGIDSPKMTSGAYTCVHVQNFLFMLKPPSRATQHVVASSGQWRRPRVFLDAKGKLAAMFLLGLVENWDALP